MTEGSNKLILRPKRTNLFSNIALYDTGESAPNYHLRYGPSDSNCLIIDFSKKKDFYKPIKKVGELVYILEEQLKDVATWINTNYDILVAFYKQKDGYDAQYDAVNLIEDLIKFSKKQKAEARKRRREARKNKLK